MRRLLLSIALVSTPTFAANGDALKPPARYIHMGACPFECCTYRDWVTEKGVTLLDRPEGKKAVATLAKGETVKGLTGEVISTPVKMLAAEDIADSTIKKGDALYRLHYAGEGYWVVWYRGKLFTVELPIDAPDQYDADAPTHDPSVWWVKIRTRNGLYGWVRDEGQFSNQDACG